MILRSSDRVSLRVATGDALDVRECTIVERMNEPFDIQLVALSANGDVDFDGVIGGPVRLELRGEGGEVARAWSGVCETIELRKAEEDGLSTYSLRIVPALWLLSQRRTYRIFQDQSELDIVLGVLAEWAIPVVVRCGPYPSRRYRAQYAESDLTFVHRLLEDIGVSYHFETEGEVTVLVLVDAPNRRSPRPALPFVSSPNLALDKLYVTDVRSRRRLRPGRYTQSDVDYRKPLDYPLAASSRGGTPVEARLERYHHNYGSFLWKGGLPETPHADDRGPARTNELEGNRQVARRLEAQRSDARICTFSTTARDLAPGVVMTIGAHPRAEIAAPLLVLASTIQGDAEGNWSQTCEASFASNDHRPALSTPKPRSHGVESATVTGPIDEEIHTDEFGRVRVRFHWDREGRRDDQSSCWVPVSQAWAGAGFGAVSIPRVGQEVLVDFLGADPDRPVVMGRVFTTTNPPPYKLPDLKMVGGMRSESYPKPKPRAAMGGGLRDVSLVRSGGHLAREGTNRKDLRRAALRPHAAPQAGPASLTVEGVTPARRRPAGGGPAAVGLGAGLSLADLPAIAGRILPGLFGGPQADPDLHDESVSTVNAQGPDGVDTRRTANGLILDDTALNEQLYLQAQLDMSMSVKNNLAGGIGANRAFCVAGNDSEQIEGFQATSVGMDRMVEVRGLQKHDVTGDILVNGGANQVVTIQNDALTATVNGGQIFEAKAGIIMTVGSTISVFMLPDGIVIDAPAVFINPGADMVQALKAGLSVGEAAAAAQRAADAAKLRADAQALREAMLPNEEQKFMGETDPTGDGYRFAAEEAAGNVDPSAYGAHDELPLDLNRAQQEAARLGYGTPEAREALYRATADLFGPPTPFAGPQ